MSALAIEAEALTRDFQSVRAVDGLTLAVPRGAVFGFLGPNGAGKTTTIRLLLGLLKPTGGRAEVLGWDTRRNAGEIRARTGALLEHDGLYERLSAEENLDFYGRIWKMPAGDRRARCRELLAHLGLWERRRELAGNWSRGMKQKLAVARAIFHRPPLVFLDEPTAGLDPVAAASLRDDIHALAAHEGVTIFLTTHNLTEAERLCSLVGVIRQGRLLAVGSPDRLRADGGSAHLEIIGRGFDARLLEMLRARPGVGHVSAEGNRLRVELRAGTDTAPLIRTAVEAGAEIEEARRDRASLEQVFLTLMEEERQ